MSSSRPNCFAASTICCAEFFVRLGRQLEAVEFSGLRARLGTLSERRTSCSPARGGLALRGLDAESKMTKTTRLT